MVEFIKLGRPDACERELAHLPKKIIALAAGPANSTVNAM